MDRPWGRFHFLVFGLVIPPKRYRQSFSMPPNIFRYAEDAPVELHIVVPKDWGRPMNARAKASWRGEGMRNPSPEDEVALHQRLLARDPVAYADAFLMYMDRLAKILERKYDVNIARDAALDAVEAYRKHPDRCVLQKGRPFPYIMQTARHKAIDRWRSACAQARREKEHSDVEDQRRTPKEELERMETLVRARQLVERLEAGGYLSEQSRALLWLILSGETRPRRWRKSWDCRRCPRLSSSTK